MKLPSPEEIRRDVLAMPQVAEGCRLVGVQVFSEAELLARERAFDLGDYAEGLEVQTDGPGPGVTVAATDRKSEWLEQGTGIYGPERTPITPKRGKFLVFRLGAQSDPRTKNGPLIFARSVKGRKASWVMRDAAQNVADRLGLKFSNLRDFRG